MRSERILLLAAMVAAPLLLAALAGCGSDTGDEDTTPPPPPTMRLKGCDEGLEWPETGIDAEAGGQGIRVEWTQLERPADLAGFQVWRSLHPDSTFEPLDLDPGRFLEGNPAWFAWVDADPELRPETWWGPRAWYLVRAVDEAGNLSAPSDTASYRLWAAPRVVPDWVSVDEGVLEVQWQFQYADLFVFGFRGFRLLIADPAGLEPVWTREIRLGLEPTMTEFVDLAQAGLAPGDWQLRIDTLVDAVEELDPLGVDVPSNPDGCALTGSESNWISFIF